MHPLTFVNALYGQARGYRRLEIRRRVAANQCLPRATLARTTEDSFQRHVHRCLERFPFYAERVKAHRGSLPRPGETVRPEELPVWTRDLQREFFAQQTRPGDAAYPHQTSGSTALPIRFYVTRESYEWRTAVMDRAYAWGGAAEGVKSLHVWPRDTTQRSLVQSAKRAAHLKLLRWTFVDAYQQTTEGERAACCALINRVKPSAIVGYTGVVVELARHVRDHGGLAWKARTLVTAAEGLQPGQRELLQTHLVDQVFVSYGSREFMSIGMECERHTGYHVATDNLWLEVVDDAGRPVPAGTEGRIVITDFHNAATPFIRYEVGDIGVMAPADEVCPCGRPFPLLRSVDGRLQDVIHTPAGPLSAIYVTYTMRQFDGWVEGYQVVQHAPDGVLIRLVSREPLTPERLAPVTELLRKKLANMTIDYERVNELSRRRSGKVELVVSTVGRGK